LTSGKTGRSSLESDGDRHRVSLEQLSLQVVGGHLIEQSGPQEVAA